MNELDPKQEEKMKKERMLEKVSGFLHSRISHKGDEERIEHIIDAMRIVDRSFFVEDEGHAYVDGAAPIGGQQTISQPSTVGRMLLLAELERGQKVLEVGSGSGWNAALVTFIVHPGKVISLERISGLTEKAKSNVRMLHDQLGDEHAARVEGLDIRTESIFARGEAWKEKYDRVIITAGADPAGYETWVMETAKELLRVGGVLVCPMTSGPIVVVRKTKKGLSTERTSEQYAFVPLVKT